jgi:uncharacterized repeat protein (TIGR03806 family)
MRVALLLLLGCIYSCSPVQKQPQVTIFERSEFPSQLSQWGLLYESNGRLVANSRVIPYDLKSSLFSDYAQKFRTVYVPPKQAGTISDDEIALPVGSILSKTFFYPVVDGTLQSNAAAVPVRGNEESGLRLDEIKLIETRLLVHLDEGWVGLPYVWNAAGNDATLEIAGSEQDLSLVTGAGQQAVRYVVPDFNQCQGCHIENLTAGNMVPIGFKLRHLDKSYRYLPEAENQLSYLVTQGVLVQRPDADYGSSVDWQNEQASLDDRARSYLDINCGHCHNPSGAADTSGMFLTRATTEGLRLGVCKPPVAAGQGTGGRPVGISPGHPERSILTYRMASQDLGAMMPELGRSLVHQEGVALVTDWIAAMETGC